MNQDKSTVKEKEVNRPLFLSIICILTYIGSGLGVLGSIWGFAPSTIESGLDAMKEMQKSEFDLIELNEAEFLKWTYYSNVAGVIGGVLCITGALLMWRLRRIGFYIYTPGYFVTMVVAFLSMSHISLGSQAGMSKAIFVLNVFVMIGFLVMYARNLKHMK